MEKLEKKKYCIIYLENTDGMRDIILSIAVDPYKYIQGDNMLIVTFTTFLNPLEMKEVFGSHTDRSYFLFEMNHNSAMVSVSDKRLQTYLFDSLINPRGIIDVIDTKFGPMGINNINNDIEKKELYKNGSNNPLIDMLSRGGNITQEKEDKFSEEKLESYTKEERDELVDELLEKGADLTENDKEVLSFLINKKD